MQVSAYVDRTLDARSLHAFDRHLVTCQVCLYAAQEESRLLASLRSGATPGVSADLRMTLLAMAHPRPEVPSDLGRSRAEGVVAGAEVEPRRPEIPRPTMPVAHLRVPTVAPASPALHRSPRRAAMVAGLAAGASAAAAIGLAVVGPGVSAASPLRQPETRTPVTTSLTALSASFSRTSLAETSLAASTSSPRGAKPDPLGIQGR